MTTVQLKELMNKRLNELAEEGSIDLDAPLLSAEEFDYAMARLKSRPFDPFTPEQMTLDLELIRLYPRSLDYYRERAETARWRVLDLRWRAWHCRRAERQMVAAGARK